LTMGVKAGMEPGVLWEAIRNGAAGKQRTFDGIGRRFLQGDFDPATFELRLAANEASLATQIGKDAGVPMRLCNLATAELVEAANRGWGDRDAQSFMLLQQERAGVPAFALAAEEVDRIVSPHSEPAT
jgi:3-hydroxyisobutyrate dehydrogenase